MSLSLSLSLSLSIGSLPSRFLSLSLSLSLFKRDVGEDEGVGLVVRRLPQQRIVDVCCQPTCCGQGC